MWEEYDCNYEEGENLLDFIQCRMVAEDSALKGDFAPYIDIKNEDPVLRESFGEYIKVVCVNGIVLVEVVIVTGMEY
jgi:hypothetical protein